MVKVTTTETPTTSLCRGKRQGHKTRVSENSQTPSPSIGSSEKRKISKKSIRCKLAKGKIQALVHFSPMPFYVLGFDHSLIHFFYQMTKRITQRIAAAMMRTTYHCVGWQNATWGSLNRYPMSSKRWVVLIFWFWFGKWIIWSWLWGTGSKEKFAPSTSCWQYWPTSTRSWRNYSYSTTINSSWE